MTEEEATPSWKDIMETCLTEAEELNEYPISLQKRIIKRTVRECALALYGEHTFEMRCLLGAHHAIKKKTLPAGEGSLASTSIGSISTTSTMEVNNPEPDKSLKTTTFGREYAEMRKNLRTAFSSV